MKKITAATFGIAMTASAAQAVEVTGGYVELSYSAFTEETELNKVSISGALEVAFNRNISTQFDIGNDSFGVTGLESRSFGFHGIYHVSDETSLGAFYSREKVEFAGLSTDIDMFGVEAGHELGQFSLEGYLGRGEAEDVSGTLLGISGRYGMENGIGLTGALDYLDVEGVNVHKLTVRLDKDVAGHLNLFAELGTAKASGFGISGSDPFVGIGGRITFGADRGATFERRSLGDLLPGL